VAERPHAEFASEPDAFERPFKKTLVDVYDHLALGVAANVTTLVILSAALSGGFLFSDGPSWAPLAASVVGALLVAPALAWGLARLALAMARHEDPSYWMLFSGFGRPYLCAAAYLALGIAGAIVVGFMAWFWGHAPVWGSPLEVGVGAMWLGLGVLGACAHLLGWPVLVLSEGKPLYTSRLVLALLAVSPASAFGYLVGTLAVALVVALPILVQWRGLGAGACVMFTVFMAAFLVAMASANIALQLIDVFAEREEASEPDEKTPSTEEDCIDG